VSALVRQLKDDGVVVKTEDKRKSYFSLAWAMPSGGRNSPTPLKIGGWQTPSHVIQWLQ
jgi:hypothetical protein